MRTRYSESTIPMTERADDTTSLAAGEIQVRATAAERDLLLR